MQTQYTTYEVWADYVGMGTEQSAEGFYAGDCDLRFNTPGEDSELDCFDDFDDFDGFE